MRAVQAQRRRRGLHRDERADHDHPGIALDEGDVGQAQAADLVDAIGDFEQALPGVQRRLTPQARVDAVRRITGQGRVSIVVTDHLTSGVAHHPGRQRAMKPRSASATSRSSSNGYTGSCGIEFTFVRSTGKRSLSPVSSCRYASQPGFAGPCPAAKG